MDYLAQAIVEIKKGFDAIWAYIHLFKDAMDGYCKKNNDFAEATNKALASHREAIEQITRILESSNFIVAKNPSEKASKKETVH